MTAVTPTPAPRGSDPRPRAGGVPRRRGLGLAVLLCAVLLISVDMTVLDFAVPSLSASLAPSGTQLLWIVDVYGLVIASLLLLAGALGDRIGRRRLLLWGTAAFGVASVLAALAADPAALIAARALQGAAGATLMPSTLALIRRLYPHPAERRRAIGMWSAAFAVGSGAGPLIGGYLLEHFWWGSVFLVNVPVVVFMLVLGPWVLPGRDGAESTPAPLDVAGVLLAATTVFSGVFAVKELLAHGGDAATIVAISLVVSAAAATALARHLRSTPHPLIDPALLSNPRMRTLLGLIIVATATLGGSLYLLTQQLQIVYGQSPTRAAWLLVPGTVASALASVVVARLARRWGARLTLVTSLLVGALGPALLAFLPVTGSLSAELLVTAAFTAIGIAAGLMDPVATDAILAAAPAEKAGAASALGETAYELGGGLGVAVLGGLGAAVYARRLPEHLADSGTTLDPAALTEAAQNPGSAAHVATTVPGEAAGELMRAAAEAFTQGLHLAAWVGAALFLAAVVAVFRHLPDDRPAGGR